MRPQLNHETWLKLIAETSAMLEKILHLLKLCFLWIRFLQVPIAAGLVAAGLGYFAWRGIGPAALVRGAYDGQNAMVYWVATFASFYSIALWDITRVIIKYGPYRFRLAENEKCPPWLSRAGGILMGILFALVPLFTALACNEAGLFGLKDWAAWIIAPAALLSIFIWLSTRKHSWLVGLIGRVKFLREMKHSDYPGYVYVEEKNGEIVSRGLAAGHLRQAIIFGVSILFVALIRLFNSEHLPAVVFVLVALLGVAWILSGLGFFLIYHRVPLFLVVLAWLGVGGFFFHKPYTYRVVKTDLPQSLPHPHAIIETPYAEVTTGGPPLPRAHRRIAVAAVGGGIHSGAWAAEVLTRIQELPGCGNFHKQICALSGTSGGSYGAMLYANHMYRCVEMESCSPNEELTPKQLKSLSNLRTTVQMPSLGAVVRSLAYDDLPGYLYPQFSPLDRGNALEQRWVENAGRGLEKATLADWAERAVNGLMPAVFFTSGSEESGRPMVYGTSVVSDWNWNVIQTDKDTQNCECSYENYTVPVVTGARLSASFPYVSPAAKPDAPISKLRRVEHQIDGGYYDNYGIVALNRWLDEGFTALTGRYAEVNPPPKDDAEMKEWKASRKAWIREQRIGKFLVIQIRYRDNAKEPTPNPDGFLHQLTAPLNGLVSSRVAGQSLRADAEFAIFCRYWEEQGIQVQNARFDFDDEAALSWHLTPKDKQKLLEAGEAIHSNYKQYSASRPNYLPQEHDGIEQQKEKEAALKTLRELNPNGASAWLVAEFIRESKKHALLGN